MTNNGTIFVAEHVLRELHAHARAAFPREMVGLLTGAGRAVTDLVPVQNVANTGDRFEVDPVTFQREVAAIEARGRDFLGFAHSHPGGTAELSDVDCRELWRGCLQLVYGIRPDGEDQIACYLLDERGTHRLPLIESFGVVRG